MDYKSAEFWANFTARWLVIAAFISGLAAISTGFLTIFQYRAQKTLDRYNEQRVATIELAAEDAKKATSQANLEITALNFKVADANEKAAVANLAAETEKKERLKLAHNLSGRQIDNEIQNLIKSRITKYMNKSLQIEITKIGDSEASAYADQWISLFKSLGMNVNVQTIGSTIPPTYGVIVLDTKDHIMAKVLFGLDDLGVRITGISSGLPQIFIGLKPHFEAQPSTP